MTSQQLNTILIRPDD
jgi:hypothetical protein